MNSSMHPRVVRIRKEVRALFWFWCAVMVAAVLTVLFPQSSYAAKLNFLSFFFGVPVLATLSFGNEFYHHTFALWLAQPVSRMQLWADKMIVMCAAVLSAAAVSLFGMFFFALPKMKLTYNNGAAVAYVIITLAAATFWTLAARSTVGGLLILGFIWAVIYRFIGNIETGKVEAFPQVSAAVIFAFALALACLMLWLGARKLAQFQVTGGSSGEDLMVAGPSVMPEALGQWFRCRPSGEMLNLIRKEFRLLRPLWVIESMLVVYLTCLAIFRLLPSPPVFLPDALIQWAILGPPTMTAMGLVGLAGILSLGEEKRSGTHTWHMTLPVAARTQWLVKLVIALFAGLACSVLLPLLVMIVVGSVYGSPFMFVYLPAVRDWFIVYPILTFSCFWCACAANGTVSAAIWACPVTFAIPATSAVGLWLGRLLAQRIGTFSDLFLSAFHRSPFAFATIAGFARGHVLWLFVPVLLFALFHSYRLFRAPTQNSRLWVLRCLLAPVAITLLWSFSASAGLLSSHWEPFEETRHVLDQLDSGMHDLQLAGEDLIKGASLSAATNRWLQGARVVITGNHATRPSGYIATFHLASGLECRLIVSPFGASAASCGR